MMIQTRVVNKSFNMEKTEDEWMIGRLKIEIRKLEEENKKLQKTNSLNNRLISLYKKQLINISTKDVDKENLKKIKLLTEENFKLKKSIISLKGSLKEANGRNTNTGRE